MQKKLWQNLDKLNVHSNKIDNVISDEINKPNEINNYFINSIGHSHVNPEVLNKFKNNKIAPNVSFKFAKITMEEIINIVKNIKSNAVGYDNISLIMLKLILPYCIDTFKNILNASLETGNFPTLWKKSIVIPLPKVKLAVEFSQLRPINILSVLSKVLEKAVNMRLTEYLEVNAILPDNQSGFRHSHSTKTALLKVVNDISIGLDNKQMVVLILLDQSKAFDLVNLELLLAILHYIGFGKTELNWFRSYLTKRCQAVKLNNDLSSFLFTHSGVPQGSILGPSLFSIFIFELPLVFESCFSHFYCDDIQILHQLAVTEIVQAFEKINSDLNNIYNWCVDYGLRLNPNKSVALLIGSNNLRKSIMNTPELYMGGEKIKFDEKAKNLGVIFDVNLNFTSHVNMICQQSYFKLKSLYRHKLALPKDLKLKLVNTLILPKLEYCAPIYYYFLSAGDKYKLQKIQNSCIRFTHCISRREHMTPYYKALSILKMDKHITYLYCTFLHQLITTMVPQYLVNALVKRSSVHKVNIRHDNYTVTKHKTSKFEGCFLYTAPYYLNKILPHLLLSTNMFKNWVKRNLLDSQ
jgi:hypothetical protein